MHADIRSAYLPPPPPFLIRVNLHFRLVCATLCRRQRPRRRPGSGLRTRWWASCSACCWAAAGNGSPIAKLVRAGPLLRASDPSGGTAGSRAVVFPFLKRPGKHVQAPVGKRCDSPSYKALRLVGLGPEGQRFTLRAPVPQALWWRPRMRRHSCMRRAPLPSSARRSLCGSAMRLSGARRCLPTIPGRAGLEKVPHLQLLELAPEGPLSQAMVPTFSSGLSGFWPSRMLGSQP